MAKVFPTDKRQAEDMRGGVKDHRVLLHFRSSGSKGQYVLILLDIAKLLCLETAAAAAVAAAKSLQSCLTLCDPIEGNPPGSPISGILQARTLEWVAISFSNV